MRYVSDEKKPAGWRVKFRLNHKGMVDILPRLKSGDSYGAHPGIEPE